MAHLVWTRRPIPTLVIFLCISGEQKAKFLMVVSQSWYRVRAGELTCRSQGDWLLLGKPA